MPTPFRSTIFTGGSFAASGSNGHESAGLLIYSSSRSTSGLLPTADLSAIGKDVFLFVSGVRGSRGTTTAGTMLIGGDLVVSGTAYDGSGNVIGSGGSSSPTYFTSPQSGIVSTTGSLVVQGNLVVQGTATQVETLNLVVKDPVILIGSGAIGTNRNGGIALASGSSVANQSLVWGRVANDTWGAGKYDVSNGSAVTLASMDLVPIRASKFEVGGAGNYLTSSDVTRLTVSAASSLEINSPTVLLSGSLYSSGVVTASLGFSGSLTRLPDGTSYLVAGTNVTITSQSNGQVTIASTGGSGSPAGSNTYVQFNDSGSFGASSGLAYEKATSTLTGATIKATSGITGSLTKLADGTSLISAGVTSATSQTGSIAVTTGSTGQITVASYVFPSDLTVSLTGGRTFGRYATGATIPATGKTPAEVILLAIAEPIAPTVATPTATNILTSVWNTTGSVTTSLTGSYTINSLGASVASARLEFRSGSGTWTVLTTSTSTPLLYDHTFTVGSNFTSTLNYNHIVVDSVGAVATGSVTLTPQTYASPTVGAITLARTTLGGITGESNTTRERGNTVSAITGTITRQRTNAPLSSYSVQYRVNSAGGYTIVPGLSGSIPAASSSYTFTGLHNEAALLTSVTSALDYIVSVVDTWQTSSLTPTSNTITFLSTIFYGTASAAPVTSTDVRNLPNKVFTTTANPFTLNTGATNRFFTVALPTRNTSNDNISSVTDTDALGADITANYVNSAFNVADGGGVNSIYNVYTMEVSTPYASDHRHVVTRA